MAVIDVFNGDADGLCALLQLRNAEPQDSVLVSGVKRDIALLNRVKAAKGDKVTVLDVSLDKNRDGLAAALAAGAEVFYVDHHFAGEIPDHPALTTHINTSADVCTSLLVNGHLRGVFAEWAVVGAFGDNLRQSAITVAKSLDLKTDELNRLENLGIYLNYNGYGATLEDLHFEPIKLFEAMRPYSTPSAFMEGATETFEQLEAGYHNDMRAAAALPPVHSNDNCAVYVLPNERWARRVSGVYSNDLANGNPDRAHAVLTEKANGEYLVSVRAPLNNKQGADEFCRQFPTGGGRAAAAGINDLPGDSLEHFCAKFDSFYRGLAK
ncbi:MAG: DHH family phosphoesterase [Spongiibacter sp.]|uniref:DHH family phosphoesterase n=1 Tax=Spongiibacter thalassae TaxID=2721624 RepID=A0ABX1GCI3_9GAMM|nr:DHH family phosphoesterase [Spongiibacter thalassae]MDX1505195.1 DHH family phosphoesterase [Spongiibacter sp.]NKI16874.1 DHH family phosphoesterase [Spongiibacter thalassae]